LGCCLYKWMKVTSLVSSDSASAASCKSISGAFEKSVHFSPTATTSSVARNLQFNICPYSLSPFPSPYRISSFLLRKSRQFDRDPSSITWKPSFNIIFL
jgi:hypothetical protein